MPRKVFVAGEILTAADVNTNLMDQAVMVFDDAAARTAAIPSPTEGMVTYLKDTDSVDKFDGTNFVPVGIAPAILQVVQAVKTDTFSSASTSFTEITGLTASITPSATSSKILVVTSLSTTNSTANNGSQYRIQRGATDILLGDAASNRTRTSFGNVAVQSNHDIRLMSMSYLDSPNTTSSTTYSIEMRMVSASAGYVNRSGSDSDSADFARAASTLTLMEVAG